MALGHFSRRKKKALVPRLQITAMMDMFTIIMIFLLVSFSSKPERMTLEDGMELPHSSAKMGYSKDVRLVLSTTALTLDGEILGELTGPRIDGIDPGDLQSSDLYRKLRAYREEAAVAPSAETDVAKDEPTHLLFLCDKRVAFETINSVIKTAGMAGYPNLQFAVLER